VETRRAQARQESAPIVGVIAELLRRSAVGVAVKIPTHEGRDMGFFSKDIKTLEDLFKHGLEDLYYAEKEIMQALPDMIEKATNPQLRAGFEKHLAETEGQVHRLEQVFEKLEAKPKGEKCPAIDGILKEGKDLIGEIGDDDVMNVGLVAAAQAVEHYEITRYGALIAWASELGRRDVIPLLKASLAEEKATDAKLTALAELRVNPQAEKGDTTPKSTARRKKTAPRPAAKAKRAAPKKARRRA
jgi:ferritin-like metal-binding protein YciE